ncbi:MAG: hypothetical protein HQ546_07145 [Planctomycetes bacterium]|nr:hypothetical protein [Planctomycetota bacterium]
MAKRITIPKKIEKEVLTKSRRRCCICFGLNADDSVRQGQLAHLDQKRTNNDPDNLAFLCFDHHNQYDSKPSQSKNFTIQEVKRYRKQLYDHILAGGLSSKLQGCCGKLTLADAPPIFRPNPKTFAMNPELVRGGRIVNIGNDSIVLGDSIEVQTLDASGKDLEYARPESTEYRVRNPGERRSYENIDLSTVAALRPGYEVFVGVIVQLEPDRRFESIRLIIPIESPVPGVFPVDVKVEWP